MKPTRVSVIRMSLISVVLGALACGATAQDSAQQKLLAVRAAKMDAYRQLAETINGFEINSQTLVRDFVTESDQIQAELDTFVRGVRFDEPRYLADGSAEIDGEVTVAKVIETLRTAHSRHYKGNTITTRDFEQMTQRIEKSVVRVTGMGAPREDTPPGIPAEVDIDAGAATLVSPTIPALWVQQAQPRGRLMAKRAAELDAKRQLAERIKGLRLTSQTLVRDFATESDIITSDLQATLRGATVTKVYYQDQELICEAEVRIPTEQVITAIKTLYSRHYRGNQIKSTEIEQITRSVVKRDFTAVGYGTVPERYRRQVVAEATTVTVSSPGWLDQKFRATGSGTDPDISSAQGKLKARRAATVEAYRNLAEQINGLTITGSTTVRDFVTERDEIEAQVRSRIRGAEIVSERQDGDVFEVTVEVDGVEIWTVVGHAYRISIR